MSPRVPGRHDQPVTPMFMTDEAVLQFQHDIASGYDGRAQWRRDCQCEHAKKEHVRGKEQCMQIGCRCNAYQAGQHERLDLWLHPDVAQWLPEWVHVEAIGRRYDRDGFVQFRLVRDWDSAAVKVMRAGVRHETLRPEGGV